MQQLSTMINLHEVSSSLFEGVIITDDEGYILTANNAVIDFFPKLVMSDLIGKQIHNLISSRDLALFYSNKQDMRNIPVSIGMCQLLANFRVLGSQNILINMKNITTLNQLTKDLSEAQNQLRIIHNILDQIDEGICFIDNRQQIIFYNNKMGELDSKEPTGVREELYTTAFNKASITKEPLLNALLDDKKISQYQAFFSNSGKRYTVNKTCEPLYLGNKKIGALSIVKDFSKKESLINEIFHLKQEQQSVDHQISIQPHVLDTTDPIAASKTMKKLLSDASRATKSSTPVLIYGEKGVGKNKIASYLTNHIKIENSPVYSLNCAAVPDSLLDDALFGTIDKKGLLELANGGAIVLDDICSMGLLLQEKLFRVIADKKTVKAGTSTEMPIRIRFIGLMNEKPDVLLKKRKLSEDLFYALSGITLSIPPLRERKEDIPPLIEHFIQAKRLLTASRIESIEEEALEQVMNYNFSGNVRQLEFLIEGILTRVQDEKTISARHLPAYITDFQPYNEPLNNIPIQLEPLSGMNLMEQIEAFEKEMIIQTLGKSNYHITNAAEQLGLSRQSLNYKIKKYEIPIIRGGNDK